MEQIFKNKWSVLYLKDFKFNKHLSYNLETLMSCCCIISILSILYLIQKNHNSLFLPLKNLTRLCDKRDKKWERETTSLLLMICTDSSDQCIGFFLCQEVLDLKERVFLLKSFNTSWKVSTHTSLLGKNLLTFILLLIITDN